MHLRFLVKQRWTDAGLYKKKDARLQAFLKYIDDHPTGCWDEYVQVFRSKYRSLLNQVVPPLLSSTDKLLRVVLIRYLDPKQPKELTILRKLVRDADVVRDRPELNAVMAIKNSSLHAEMKKRPALGALLDPPKPPYQRMVTNIVRSPPKRRPKSRKSTPPKRAVRNLTRAATKRQPKERKKPSDTHS